MSGTRQGVNTDGVFLRDFFVEHDPVDIDCSKDGRTRQEFADECDINILLARYDTSSGLPFNDRPAEYLDVSNVPDLQSAFEFTAKAEQAFMSLHANIRREFDNNAIRFVEFAQDPKNVAKMREWGLAEPERAPERPIEVRVVPDPVTAPAAGAAGREST